VLCDRIAIMDSGNVIACDTPAGLIRSLDLEASVSATVVSSTTTLSETALAAIPGVRQATLSNDAGITRLTLHTSDAQATIVGLLSLANETGTVLGELGSTRANLEDVFLNLTGRSYEQTDEAPAEGEDEAGPAGNRKKRRRRGGNAT
jgi:ABC-2 type transport system ATP-binding protein